MPFRVTAAQYRWHTVLGLVLAGTAWAVSTSLALWMAPVVLGLALAIPLAAFTARRSTGLAWRRMGLLRIPEEMHPPEVLACANRVIQETMAQPAQCSGMLRLLADPELLEAHRRMMPAVTAEARPCGRRGIGGRARPARSRAIARRGVGGDDAGGAIGLPVRSGVAG